MNFAMANLALEVTISQTMGNIIRVILTIAFYVGVLITAWGIFQLIMAFRNEDAENKTKAIQVLLAGILLMGLGGIMELILGENIDSTVSVNKVENL